jgi:hypothetical protein
VALHLMIGFVGTAGYLLSYILLQAGIFSGERPAYALMNLGSAVCMAYSLLYDWNFPSMVIQIAWIAISLGGLLRMRMKPPTASA